MAMNDVDEKDEHNEENNNINNNNQDENEEDEYANNNNNINEMANNEDENNNMNEFKANDKPNKQQAAKVGRSVSGRGRRPKLIKNDADSANEENNDSDLYKPGENKRFKVAADLPAPLGAPSAVKSKGRNARVASSKMRSSLSFDKIANENTDSNHSLSLNASSVNSILDASNIQPDVSNLFIILLIFSLLSSLSNYYHSLFSSC